MSVPDIIVKLVHEYLDGRKDAVWQHKQSGQWLIKHRDLEIVAAKAGIEFLPPQVLEADASKCIAIVVTGKLSTRTEWSIGEASPKNTQQAYPYAMAEKRAKDRVILKLMQVHGHIYSEDEMPDEAPVTSIPQRKELSYAEKDAAALDHAKIHAQAAQGYDKVEYYRQNKDIIDRIVKYPDAKAVLVEAGFQV